MDTTAFEQLEPEIEGPSRPSLAMWMPWLFFKPRSFFLYFAASTPTVVLVIVVWLSGVAGIIDRMELRGGSPILPRTWSGFWTFVAVAAILSGLLRYAIGGWWYRVRVKWSSDLEEIDPYLARRVYFFASLVVSIPLIMSLAIESTIRATPQLAFQMTAGWELFTIIFLPWSYWISYRGVREVFEARRIAAIIWFLALPLLMLCIFLGGGLLLGFVMSSGPADVQNPIQFNSRTFSFEYPGNWFIDEDPDFYNPDAVVFVEPTWQDAYIQLVIYESEMSEAAEVNNTIQTSLSEFSDIQVTGESTELGRFQGVGKEITAMFQTGEYTISVFVTRLSPQLMLEIETVCFTGQRDAVQPGFDQVIGSLDVRLP